MTICFIPARGGSKRIPGKNSRVLGGRPLLAWTIDAAQHSGRFDQIVVSSDDDKILAIAGECRVVADRRAPELAGDRVRFVEVLEEYLKRPENLSVFREVVVLLPTCPFRTAEDIRQAIDLQRTNPESFVVTVSSYDFPPDFACDFSTLTGELKLRHPEVYSHSTQSQSVTPAFHPNGAIYVGSVDRFLATKSFFAEPIRAILLPPERSFDLDHPHQWEIAEALIEKFRKP